MKKIILTFCILIFPVFSNAEDLELDNLRGQKIYELKDNNGSVILTNKSSKYENLKVEKETYYPDKKSLDKWYSNCTKDKFNGIKSCTLNTNFGDIIIYYAHSKYAVWVGRNHYPNTQSAIKIDNNATIYGHEGDSNTPLKVIEQMKKGKVAYTRYKEWPYLSNKDNEAGLEGFSEALDEMKTKYSVL